MRQADIDEGIQVAGKPSVRAGQFRSRAFPALLKAAGLTGSMGRVAAAGDNAPMESFYSLLQKNVLDRVHTLRRTSRSACGAGLPPPLCGSRYATSPETPSPAEGP